MNRLKMLLCASAMLISQPAFAEVITVEHTDGYADYLYVAGDNDNYPIEFYDEDKNTFSGIIPDMLGEISEQTGINFAYINGDGRERSGLGESMQVDIVSSADGAAAYTKDYLELISYEKDGRVQRLGISFTDICDEEKILALKTAIGSISETEKNSIALSYASQKSNMSITLVIALIILMLIFAGVAVFLIKRIGKIKDEYENNKMIDEETGLGNLHFFKHHFRYTIGDLSRSLYHISYIMLDSSYLRSYHGDSSFEDVLKYTALVLSEYTGDREISARISENGFAYAFQSTNREDAEARLTEIVGKLNRFESLREKSNKPVFHVAAYPLSGNDKNCELLLFNLRKNCIRILGMEEQIIYCDTYSMNQVQEEKKITESILGGLEKNEFKMYLQFIVDNATGEIASAEALSRWDSREKGLISPDKYIENMENAGLIGRHDFYMFEQVCRQLEHWSGTKFGHISISCNFTRITLSEEAFVEKLAMISNSYNFDKTRLSIEITEDAIEKDTRIATENVKKCKEMGFNIYLDDLGSGYTSLINLCDYPIDIVKIDRNVLLKSDSQKGRELFSGIVALAHSLGSKVICEGVETKSQRDFVALSGCDYIQGWYFSKPFPIEECEDFIENFDTNL